MTTLLSPLRYPGSKRRLAKYIASILEINNLRPSLLVEPFAGGASVALHLLANDAVDYVGLIEKDPLVASFWQIIFSDEGEDFDWLIDQIEQIEITVERWNELKGTVPDERRERALVCLYLNRTSFSGILAPSSGPLGGKTQQSKYKIDCRFPRKTLVQRIRRARKLRDKVGFVWSMDWLEGLKRICRLRCEGQLPENVVYYLDPPFFRKADRLYTFYFKDEDHVQLRDVVLNLSESWILSYDYCSMVDDLYKQGTQGQVELLYSASQNGGPKASKEVILTNLENLPDRTRLWESDKS